jgi:hypothetical protein
MAESQLMQDRVILAVRVSSGEEDSVNVPSRPNCDMK